MVQFYVLRSWLIIKGKTEEQKNKRLGEEKINKQWSLMKIIEYNNSDNIVVEFQDEFKHKKRTTYSLFRKNSIRNPYYPSYLGIGIVGVKYSSNTKEYIAWSSMITRCYSKLTEQNKNIEVK